MNISLVRKLAGKLDLAGKLSSVDLADTGADLAETRPKSNDENEYLVFSVVLL